MIDWNDRPFSAPQFSTVFEWNLKSVDATKTVAHCTACASRFARSVPVGSIRLDLHPADGMNRIVTWVARLISRLPPTSVVEG